MYLNAYCVRFQDEDDQQFLMDELGNIELGPGCVASGVGGETDRSASRPQTENAQDCWDDDDDDDDASYLEALDEVERVMKEKEEIPDELMIQALTECETTLVWVPFHTVRLKRRIEEKKNG